MSTLSESEIREYNQAVLTRIRELCVRRNTSITKIEKELGFGNGTVSGWKNAKRKAPLNRVVAIAEHLRVPVIALTGERIEDDVYIKQEQPALSEKRQAALEIIEKLSDEQIDAILKLLGE